MTIGMPRGLVFYKYQAFFRSFLEELGAEIVVSPETNKQILDEGTSRCVDDACLPVKIFHGHVSWLKDKCDAVFLPRLIGVRHKEYICPMFCGLNEMVSAGIGGLPRLIDAPIYSLERIDLMKWAQKTGRAVTDDPKQIKPAFRHAYQLYSGTESGFNDTGYRLKVGLLGHAYNLYDRYVNMDIKRKLNDAGIGVVTGEYIGKTDIDCAVEQLFKKPFWTYARDYYGAAVTLKQTGGADGVIYLSSFACGVDSVVAELIKNELNGYPFMILKLDEHTGQAGFDTRLEAFSDLLKRRLSVGHHISANGQYRPRYGGAVSGA